MAVHIESGTLFVDEGTTLLTKQDVDDALARASCTRHKITAVHLPSSLTTIGEDCFDHFTALDSIEIPEGIHEIPAHCFQNCSSLSKVSLPSTLMKIGDYAFFHSGIEQFAVELPKYSETTLEAMAEARRISRDPDVKGYDSMEELKAALDS